MKADVKKAFWIDTDRQTCGLLIKDEYNVGCHELGIEDAFNSYASGNETREQFEAAIGRMASVLIHDGTVVIKTGTQKR